MGSYGAASAFSFFPAKNLGCFGDGGAIITRSPSLNKKIRTICSHGAPQKYNTTVLGGNFRLDTLQASILSILLPQLPLWIDKRSQNAHFYTTRLQHLEKLTLPTPIEGHSWNQYTLRLKNRDGLKAFLDNKGVGNAI